MNNSTIPSYDQHLPNSSSQNLHNYSHNPPDLYNPHVKSYPDYPGMKTPYTPLDYTLGTLLLLCTLVGVPGNLLGVRFFSSQTNKDRVTLLYIVICSVDIVTSISHLPVAVALFRGRKPGVFESYLFCALWEILFTVLQKMSIFLVLLISTSRTISILKPFYKIQIKAMMSVVLGYLVVLLIFPVLQRTIPALRGEFKYSWDGAYCYYNFEMKFEHTINLILVGLPPILTFVNLLICIIRLHAVRQRLMGPSKTKSAEAWKYRVSVTIAMFTGLFLICNLPLFINLMHNMTTTFFGVEYPGVYFGTRFMFWYSWHIAKIESVVVNATLNPILYYCRMKNFRSWCNCVVKGLVTGDGKLGVNRMSMFDSSFRLKTDRGDEDQVSQEDSL